LGDGFNSLIDKHIGLEELGNGIWRVFFRSELLGYLDEKTSHPGCKREVYTLE